MPISQISDAALVVLDLQVATAGLPSTPNPMPQIIDGSVRLANAFRDKGLPVVWVTVNGGVGGRVDKPAGSGELPANWAELLDELGAQPTDRTFAKQAWGTFHDDRFGALLAELGVDQIVLTGVTTSYAVESTARAAYERNYHVVVVSDAVGDLDQVAHEHSIERILPNLSEVGTVADVLAAL